MCVPAMGNGEMGIPLEAGPVAQLRDYLAEERTFLAWIRTGIALMGFGVVVARVGIFGDEPRMTQHAPAAQSYVRGSHMPEFQMRRMTAAP